MCVDHRRRKSLFQNGLVPPCSEHPCLVLMNANRKVYRSVLKKELSKVSSPAWPPNPWLNPQSASNRF